MSVQLLMVSVITSATIQMGALNVTVEVDLFCTSTTLLVKVVIIFDLSVLSYYFTNRCE